jgi:protocatechuate 3,4-dioxygenase beta subunit
VHLTAAAAFAARASRELQLKRGSNRARIELAREVVLAGAVVDDAANPVPGAVIRARPSSGEDVALATTSDEQGSFKLSELAAGAYTLEASAEHHELAAMPGVEAPSVEPVRIVLPRASVVRGEVLDAAGKPAANALVTVAGSGVWPPRRVQTDALGHFTFAKVPAGVYELRATRETWTSAPREGVLLQAASEAFVSLTLEPGATLLGRVLDIKDGKPLAQVAVTIGEDALSSTPLTIKTGADGAFTALGLRRLPHRVWIRAPGYVAIVGEEHMPGPTLQEFALQRAAVLAGQVVDERGQAVSDVELEVTGTTERGLPVLVSPPLAAAAAAPGAGSPAMVALSPTGDNLGVTTGAVPKIPLIALPSAWGAAPRQQGFLTDAAGHFRIEGVPAGKVQLVARGAGYATGRSEMRSVQAGEQVEGLRLILPRGGALLGRVVDTHDFPVAGVRIQLDVRGEPSARVTLSGEDGRFELGTVRGLCTVTAYPLAGPPIREQAQVESGQRRELLLRLPGETREIRGRVHDVRGFPIAQARITVDALSTRSPTTRSTASAPDGTFVLVGLPAPPYRVRVEHPSYAPTRIDTVSPGPQEPISIELRAGARVFGLVVDGLTNDGIGSARVRLRVGPPEAMSTRTNSRGRFEFVNLTIGKYEILVDHEGYISGRLKMVLGEPAARELDPIVLQPAGIVSGEVVDRLGAPLLDAEVALGTPPAWDHAVRTDRVGHFRFTGAEPGERWLSARHPEAGTSPVPVPVRVYPRQESPGLVLRLTGEQ